MIQMQTSLEVADNSGARRVEMIMPIGGSTGKIASLGDRIKVTVKKHLLTHDQEGNGSGRGHGVRAKRCGRRMELYQVDQNGSRY